MKLHEKFRYIHDNLCKEKCLTQTETAKAIGISRYRLHRALNGLIKRPESVFLALSELWQIDYLAIESAKTTAELQLLADGRGPAMQIEGIKLFVERIKTTLDDRKIPKDEAESMKYYLDGVSTQLKLLFSKYPPKKKK